NAICASDHFIDRAEAELGHQLAHLPSDQAHEVDYVRWIAGESRAQFWILCSYANRTSVQVTDAHHDATEADQGRGSESEFLGAEQRRDRHVTPGFQLAVGFQRDAAAQIVEYQRLMCFGQA